MAQKKIFAKVDCPRCNAVAELRPESGESNLFIVYLICKKCRFKKSVGISTWESYRMNILIEKLKFWLERADDELVRASIRAKIEKLEQQNNIKGLGI